MRSSELMKVSMLVALLSPVLGIGLGCDSKNAGGEDESASAGTDGGETGGGTLGDADAGDSTPADDGGTQGGDGDATTGADTGGDSGGLDESTGGGPTDAMCDPKAQDCPEGEKCTFYRDEANPNGSNRCVPSNGTAQVGDPCQKYDDDTDDCDVGLLCWGTEPDNETGACIEFCDPAEQCSTGDPCTITNDGALPICLPKCDPLAAECPPGWACYDDFYSDDWFCDRDKSGPMGVHGDPCGTINSCDDGLICGTAQTVASETCVSSGSTACCQQICDISDPMPNCPGAGEECLSYYDIYGIAGGAPPEYENVGVCAIQQ